MEQYKNKIAEHYIKNFKDELNFFEKIMILPVSKKMEEILKSSKKIDVGNLGDLEDLGFWRKVLGRKIGDKGLFEKLTSKIFNFLKEKQEKIIQAESSGKLKELQELVINGKLDDLQTNIDESSENIDDNLDEDDSQEPVIGQDNNVPTSIEEDDDKKKEPWYQNVDSRLIGTGTGVITGAEYKSMINRLEKVAGIDGVKEIPEGFDVERTKKLMKNISEDLSEKAKLVKNNRAMKKSYEKSAKIFEESASSLSDDVGKAFMERNSLGNKLPESSLKSLKVNSKFTKLIDSLPDQELAHIIGENINPEHIKNFFKSKGINITDDLAKQLKLAEHVSDLRCMNNVFKHATKLGKLTKGFKGLGALAVIGMGVDVWVYFETMKEVDAVKKINSIRGDILHDKARMQLGIGVATLLTEAVIIIGVCAAGGSMGGPIGLAVGLAVGAVSFATSVLVDELYYDKKEYYSKNRYDYINDERSLIKQSIVRLLESDRLGMNEPMKLSIQENAKKQGKSINTQKEAREALIYKEEISEGKYSYLTDYQNSGKEEPEYELELFKSNPDEYNSYLEEKKEMEEIIKIRMEYIQNYIQKDENTPEYISMKNMISQNRGIEYIENILANSKIHHYLKGEHNDAYIENYKGLNVEEYKAIFGEKLKSEYPNEFELFEKLSKENPIHLYEICIGVENSVDGIEAAEELLKTQNLGEDDIIYSQEEIEKIKPNLFFIQKYFEYRKLGQTDEQIIKLGLNDNGLLGDINYEYIEQILLDLNSINNRPLFSDIDKVKSYFNQYRVFSERQNIDLQVSGDTGQNILYSMAKEFHGFDGNNDTMDIINFYNEHNKDFTGTYYDSEWRISRDLTSFQKVKAITSLLIGNFLPILSGVDPYFNLEDIDKKNMTSEQVYSKLVEGEFFTQALSNFYGAKGIKAPIDSADDQIVTEFKNRLKTIIEREIGYRDQKETYENKLIDFIKNQCANREGYLEIPYDLLIECKKAKIGDLQNYLFKMEDGKIFALSTGVTIGQMLNLDQTNHEIIYESLTPMRNKLTGEEFAVIDKVKIAHDRLENIISLQSQWTQAWGGHKKDLDIPIELEKQISKKRFERQKIEKSLFYLTPNSSISYLQENWEIYYSYFEDTYIGMMATISQFQTGNDLGNISYMNMARSWIGKNIIEINDNTISIPESVNLEDDEKYYLLKYIKEIKDTETNKTAEELLLSTQDDPKGLTVDEQHEKGQWMARQILIAVLEQETILFDNAGKPIFINCNLDLANEKIKDGEIDNSFRGNYRNPIRNKTPSVIKKEFQKLSQKKMEERIKVHLGYPANIYIKKGLNSIDIEDIEVNDQKIVSASDLEAKTHIYINDLLKTILDTKDNVDRTDKRGISNFIPDYESITEGSISGKFVSYDTTTNIYINNKEHGTGKHISLKIEGLDVEFGLEEGLRMANQINWTKDYLNRNPKNKGKFFYGTASGALCVNDATWMSLWTKDTDILKSSTINKFFPKMKNISTKNKILDYLNSL